MIRSYERQVGKLGKRVGRGLDMIKQGERYVDNSKVIMFKIMNPSW